MRCYGQFVIAAVSMLACTLPASAVEPQIDAAEETEFLNRLLTIQGTMADGVEYRLSLTRRLITHLDRESMFELAGTHISPQNCVGKTRIILSASEIAAIIAQHRTAGVPDLRVAVTDRGGAQVVRGKGTSQRRREIVVKPVGADDEIGTVTVERIGGFTDMQRVLEAVGAQGDMETSLAIVFYSVVSGAAGGQRDGAPTYEQCRNDADTACSQTCPSTGIARNCVESFTWSTTSCSWTCMTLKECCNAD